MIDPQGMVKIIDFGSTRIAGIDEINKPFKEHQLLGTVNYTAPEYLRDEHGTSRSDIYALGVIAYEMLTGKLPYGEEPSLRTFQRRNYKSAISYNHKIQPWVDGAIEKAVHKDPNLRYQHLSEFIHDLDHPNKLLLRQRPQPLIERNPQAFWKGLVLILFVTNILLLCLLLM